MRDGYTLQLYDDLQDQKQCDVCDKFLDVDATDALWRVIRKFSDDSAMQVVYQLDKEKALTSGELRKATNIPGSDLNRALIDLKRLDVIVKNRDDNKYHLTSYGRTVFHVIWNLENVLSRLN